MIFHCYVSSPEGTNLNHWIPSKQQSRLKTGVASKEGMFGTILHLWPDLPGGIETHQWSTGELCLTQQAEMVRGCWWFQSPWKICLSLGIIENMASLRKSNRAIWKITHLYHLSMIFSLKRPFPRDVQLPRLTNTSQLENNIMPALNKAASLASRPNMCDPRALQVNNSLSSEARPAAGCVKKMVWISRCQVRFSWS